jgi:CDP-diacylglycerol--glycerol-3-phosphate 3-phosphatidyltransferase
VTGREAERQRPATAALLRAGLNLPNALTLSRILIVPLLVAVLLTQIEGREFIGLGLFLVASLTDFLDGFLARRRKEVTALGKLLDPAADKILTSAAFISLVGLGLAPAWMVVVVIAREFAVSSLRSLAAAQDVVLAASFAGKVKTVTQIVAISLLIISDQLGSFELLAPLSLWVALVATLYSGIEYFVRNGRRVLEAFGASPEP